MDIEQALAQLGAGADQLSPQEARSLDEKGFVVFPGIIDGPWLEALRERFEALCEKEPAGINRKG